MKSTFFTIATLIIALSINSLQAGVIAHYSFDQDYTDSSGNNHHGIAFDGNGDGDTDGVSISSTVGEHVFGGGSADFTAERDCINVTNPIALGHNEDYSLSFWARDLSSTSSGGMVMGDRSSNNFVWIWKATPFVRWRGNVNHDSYQANFTSLTLDDAWHHYVMIAGNHSGDTGDITLYMDGTIVGTMSNKYTGYSIESIGQAYASSSDFDFEGQIDEVWIFNDTLDVNQVGSLYTSNAVPEPATFGLLLFGILTLAGLRFYVRKK